MEILAKLSTISDSYTGGAIALGTFDGVHVGHQAIITKAVDLAREFHSASVIFTFEQHPLSILAPNQEPLRLNSSQGKVKQIQQLGVDVLISITPTAEFLLLSPEQFIDLLVHHVRPHHIVIGPNYSFGSGGAGTAEMLYAMGEKHGFTVHIDKGIYIENTLVSSTAIRKYISHGDVASAAKLLGRFFSISGVVCAGDQRGRALGFPTANLSIPQGLAIPANGVYAVLVETEWGTHRGVCNIGLNPTFNGTEFRLETFILDFSGNLYGQEITLQFLDRLRDERRFDSTQSLIRQIEQDICHAQQFFI